MTSKPWMWNAEDVSLLAMLSTHVDDLYCFADPSIQDSLLVKLRAVFHVRTEKKGAFIYCGLQVSTQLNERGQVTSIFVDQRTYIDKVVPMDISHPTRSQDCLS